MPIIVLKDVASDLVLPIWWGHLRGQCHRPRVEKDRHPAPHDPRFAVQNLARGLNAQVNKIVVSELRDDTSTPPSSGSTTPAKPWPSTPAPPMPSPLPSAGTAPSTSTAKSSRTPNKPPAEPRPSPPTRRRWLEKPERRWRWAATRCNNPAITTPEHPLQIKH